MCIPCDEVLTTELVCVCVCFVCSNFTEARERNITARSLRMFFEDSFDYLKDIETFRLTGLTGR